MADSVSIRKRKIKLLTPGGVQRETGLTKRHLAHLRRRGLIEPVVDWPTPLYSVDQLEEVIFVLTEKAIAVTELDKVRSRVSELRLRQSIQGMNLDSLLKPKTVTSPHKGEDGQEEAA